MAQTADKYIIRFPDGMRDRLKNAAAENGRSLNAELVARLEASFRPEQDLASVVKQAVREALNGRAHLPQGNPEMVTVPTCRCNPHTGIMECPIHGPTGHHGW